MPKFPTTHWSLIGRASQDDPTLRRAALGELLTRYLPALKAHLLFRKQIAPERVDDVLQDFITGKILEQNLLPRVVRGKGKFRTWLLTALDRFVVSEHRYRTAAKRCPTGSICIDAADHLAAPATPSDAFDHAWAREVLAETLQRMQAECTAAERPELWGVFECRVLAPTVGDTPPLPYEELVERFGLASPAQASNVLITAKRMFVRHLRAVVGEYAPGREAVDEEIRDLQRILASPGAG